MLVSAEGFFLLNFVMDFLVLSLAVRGMCFPRTKRLTLAALLGAGYALADGCAQLNWIWDALALTAMFAIAFPRGRPHMILRAALSAGNAAVLIAAAIEGLSGLEGAASAAFPLGMALGVLASEAARKRMRTFPASVWMRAQVAGKMRSFPALIDTGNMLREPLSDLPVMIVAQRTLGSAYRPETVTRSVSYGGVGSGGSIPCIRPKKLELYDNRRWVRAPEMWLGVYCGKINGGIEALAPGAVLQAMLHK